MERATITATYSVNEAASHSDASTTLTFQEPLEWDAGHQHAAQKHLDALGTALKALQATINIGLTDRLVATGVLSAEEPGEKKKIRTKVVGQQQSSKKEGKKDASRTVEAQESTTTTTTTTMPTTTTTTTTAAQDSATTASTEDDDMSSMDVDQQVASKKAFGEDEEDQDQDKDKDEVDLVMEADPGEVDGACLELPKETDLANTVKRQSESHVDLDSQASKKAKGE